MYMQALEIEGKCLHEFCKMLKFPLFFLTLPVDSAVRTVQIHARTGRSASISAISVFLDPCLSCGGVTVYMQALE